MAIRKIVARSIGVDVIVAEDLADNSITAAEITNGAVTADKLASNSVTTAKIAAGVTLTSPVMNTITSAAATALTLQSASTTAVTIDTSQNVGIGTASPATKLEVYSASSPTAKINSGNTNAYLQLATTTDGLMYIANESGAMNFYLANALKAKIDSSGNLLFNSGYGSAATAYGCRAWVNFNGTGTVAIRASGNVSSITDNGTGYYTVNFTTAMPDINYSVVGGNGSGTAGDDDFTLTTNYNAAPTTSATRIGSERANSGLATDAAWISVAIFR